ncbi:FecR family protein [Massilia sp. H6]|uniref:FecR family protein n=1 Tax=Massilia sp. H6 TaxID=2970464 RepID=UPI00216984D1|nr:FecR family protein [Massilia sp. H6]UVW28136.1 FecR family protein [Massilia sp. H6]
MQKLLLTALLVCAAHAAHAADAGKIIFVAGTARAGEVTAREGASVQEGQMLSTGGDGFIYVKTIDSGLFILRPNTRARIVTYRIDQKNPANTRIKLELLSGVARSKSGEAVKLARQNFRFNTPVAAIGVRGTDFTVFTDDDTSRVAVISGGVVVSGFTGACRPEGGGPCEGAASRELSAAQRGRLVQVRRGQAAPQLMESSPLSPDQVSPPRGDEPLVKNGIGAVSAQASVGVEAMKNSGLNSAIEKLATANPVPIPAPMPGVESPVISPPVLTPPVVEVPPVIDVAPVLPERTAIWGRWQPAMNRYASIDLSEERKRNELLALSGYFALFRSPGKDYVAPNNGSVGFSLRGSEAIVTTEYGFGNVVAAPATLSNGILTVDFGERSFTTRMDVTTASDVVRVGADGIVKGDGRMYGNASEGRHGVLNVQGILTNERGGSAAYIFDGRLDDKRTVNGAATWR